MSTKANNGKASTTTILAIASGFFLSGAMMSLSAFTVPVFLDTDTDSSHLLKQWVQLYHYGHIYLPALCVATCGQYCYGEFHATSRRRGRYALAAVSTIAMVPFTWIIMAPTNNILFGLEASDSLTDLEYVRGLVVRWAWMHVTRSLMPLSGAFLGCTALLQEIRA